MKAEDIANAANVVQQLWKDGLLDHVSREAFEVYKAMQELAREKNTERT